MSQVSEIRDDEWAVWHSFYAMRRQLDRALESQLQSDSGISTADFDILISLFGAPERRMRSRDLALRIGWEKSRISHQVRRMHERGLVLRSECEDDLRGTWIELTHEGRRTALGAIRKNTAAIRTLFFDALTPEELASVKVFSEQILDAISTSQCAESP